MKVTNIHQRTLDKPKTEIAELLRTLSTKNDKIWPYEKWPAMKFDKAIGVGAQGGHGPIHYTVKEYDPAARIQFVFTGPKGFNGMHQLELFEISQYQTEIKHTIDMRTSGKATLLWIFGIRLLHDALIEDAFDKLENNYLSAEKSTKWSRWVRVLRKKLARKKAA